MAMIGFGLTCLGLGLYYHFSSDIQKYPPKVRSPLRRALYYEQKDPTLALPYFEQAYKEALDPENGLASDGAPLTGILIQWATVLERLGRMPEARSTLILALRHLFGLEAAENKLPDHTLFALDWHTWPVLEQKKAVGICLKLGDINSALHRDKEAEKYYVAAVEHLLATTHDKNKAKSLLPHDQQNAHTDSSAYSRDLAIAEQHASARREQEDQDPVLFNQDHLPDWLTHHDVGAALATLGQFYASRSNYSYAIHLYLRALGLNGMANCQATALMNNLAESYVAMNEFKEAQQWLETAINLADNPNTGKQNNDQQICDETCGVLLFNMGMVFEVKKDTTTEAKD
ncbi:hypothetical protein DM01DRAFT_306316 [Hesseltinella vesiculosa]|uniref:Uncharacterized protein n=1 Tax=Hesseltinella vesiculosa TaxID=101127 RepID=A0A1X2GXB6_9FUNG|nr:hypothetical protein DM01DRAFT_306316 [Hesseltinella vesiculosa]